MHTNHECQHVISGACNDCKRTIGRRELRNIAYPLHMKRDKPFAALEMLIDNDGNLRWFNMTIHGVR